MLSPNLDLEKVGVDVTMLGNVVQRSVALAVKELQLKGLKRIHIQFDPFHPSTRSIRDFAFIISSEKLRLTNPSCSVKNHIVCDRSPPTIDLTAINGKKYRLLAEHLTVLELIQQLGDICTKYGSKPAEQESN
ncbi:probable 39S ribosomal protein L53, mitochondrial [Varroa jacobsoni]|uniref:Large ribosomal subunit protein mL53 n=1 Tax=Varroa destructor TaxID=109461 RepID=A0A7M7KBT3_VARDE|nr:probable 39S ribosomal protein L53, mitochondrial [Varroa destructor]XP_022701886.1 probable 39S ribosomal protein L53, mitochondrial [Varroa jacobsoni]